MSKLLLLCVNFHTMKVLYEIFFVITYFHNELIMCHVNLNSAHEFWTVEFCSSTDHKIW